MRFEGQELLGLSDKAMRRHRGADIAMVFQDPSRSLNPTMRIGAQIAEAVRAHARVDRGRRARPGARAAASSCACPRREQRLHEYPHQLSGGMRQRVVIAIALASKPRLLIADEATTALDVTTQAQIMELLRDLQRELGMALVMISHDLGLAASFADEVVVMYAGRAVEQAPTRELFAHVRMPYTKALLDAIPRVERPPHTPLPVVAGRPPDLAALPAGCPFAPRCPKAQDMCRETAPPLEEGSPGHRWACWFPCEDGGDDRRTATSRCCPRATSCRSSRCAAHGGVKGGVVQAVSDVSFDVRAGETLGVVGETGSGKSTLARSVLQAPRPKSGSVRFQGNDLVGLKGRRLLDARRSLQMVFQDPFGSLDPKWRVADIVEEPLVAYGVGSRDERRRRVREVLDTVGLDPDVYGKRRPRQLSGGQAQRVAIARALTLDPALIICDEAVSSLDVLIQAQVLNLFERLRAELGLSYLFIAHDLALVKQVSDRVAVMYLGRLCELGPAEALYREPFHPYTRGAAGLDPQPRPRRAPGGRRTRRSAAIRPRRSTRPADAASARAARARRSVARRRCPQMRELAPDHAVACHFPVERNGAPAS